MTICRTCGSECTELELFAVHEGGGCINCKGSPACTRCGHARKHHRGTFSSGSQRCVARVAVDDSVATGRCGCAGYSRDPEAFGETPAIVEINEPRLRIAGSSDEPVTPFLAPVRDLFDEARSLRDLGEHDGVPWRPAD